MTENRQPCAAVSGVDHALVAVRDLDAARAAWSALGFTVSPRGRHLGWGTANHTILFPVDYLELRGIADPTGFTDGLDTFLAQREGLFSAYLGITDTSAFHAWLRQHAAAEPAPARILERAIRFDDGEDRLRFRLQPIPAEIAPGLHSMALEQLTPEALHRPGWLSHPNGARSVLGITVLVDEPATVIPAYTRLFGAGAIADHSRRGLVTVQAGSVALDFTTPRAFSRRQYGVALETTGQLPQMAALTMEVTDPSATALYLSGQSVPFERGDSGAIVVQPAHATGVLLQFRGR